MRAEGWEKRLDDFIKKREDSSFCRGERDCALFAADCANVIRNDGKDVAHGFRDAYNTKHGAYSMLKKMGYANLHEAATDRMGEPYITPHYAKRGDWVSVKNEEGLSLAVVDFIWQVGG